MEFDIEQVTYEFAGDGTTITAVARDPRKTVVVVTVDRNIFANNPGNTALGLLIDALEREYQNIMDSRCVHRAMKSFLGTRVGTKKIRAR
jgi:hypothetical protein